MSETSLFVLLFFAGFISTFSSEPLLSCKNDYITTMNCTLDSPKTSNCSIYTAEFKLDDDGESYKCPFMNNMAGMCSCTVQMLPFVYSEEYQLDLLEGNKSIYSKQYIPSSHIKPNAPEIISIIRQENGNYDVMWKSSYGMKSEYVKYQVCYKKKGEEDKNMNNISQTNFEILSSTLEQGAVYVVRVRSFSSDYETEFSDWSHEREWTEPLSFERILEITIPSLCVALIVILAFLYWCLLRMKDRWWDKIPNPYKAHIKSMTVGKPVVLKPETADFNQQFDIIDKPWKAHLIVGGDKEEGLYPKNLLNSEGSSQSDYARTYSISQGTTVPGSVMQKILEEAFNIFIPKASMPVISDLGTDGCYKNVDVTPRKESGSSGNLSPSSPEGSASSCDSQYKNISYSWVSSLRGSGNHELVMNEKPSHSFKSPIACTFIEDYHSNDSEALKVPPANLQGFVSPTSTPVLLPLLLTDSEYQACDSSAVTTPQDAETPSTCSSKLDADLELLIPPPHLFRADDDYQSFNNAISNGKQVGAGSSPEPFGVDQITEDLLICSINPAYAGQPAKGCSLAPCEEGYSPLQGLSSESSRQPFEINGTEDGPKGHTWALSQYPEKHIVTAASGPHRSLQKMESWHDPPVLQIDNSYHRV
ncbi:interleukin-4 receptor subunit alpha isoform X1 [Paramormyrops kingsleyae]|uniref:interleukin-4 receptor subunit alpha isoform X1 n=1 Tax=Paramormyrops kingsleyae TaxID=1676925 RepID=UPI003B970319